MSTNNIDNHQETTDMIDGVDDISEKRRISYVFREWREKVNDINKKYSKPRLKMTPLVRGALLALRLYLIALVLILSYKFYTLVR